MAGRVLAFQKQTASAHQAAQACVNSLKQTHQREAWIAETQPEPAPSLRLVKSKDNIAKPMLSPSQERALRIVREAQQDVKGQPGIYKITVTERSPQFWASLPVPENRVETPLAVARRLVHLILAAGAPA